MFPSIPVLEQADSLSRAPASLLNLVNQYRHLLNFSPPPLFCDSPYFFYFAAGSIGAILFLAPFIGCSLYSRKRKSKGGAMERCKVFPTITDASRGSNSEEMTWSSLTDALFYENKTQIVSEIDTSYAEELQIQETLLASLVTCHMTSVATSSMARARPTLSSLLKKPGKEDIEPSQSFCEICLENKEAWEMYRNSTCAHSFCYNCTSKYITSKIQENIEAVTCPGLNCKAVLDFNDCRLMVTKEIRTQWDESLCKSMILESQKLYCPFRDCSALLVNDSEIVTTKVDCPNCKRPICAACLVPWHPEFTCQEFEKLNAKKKRKEVDMTEALAKKKNWRKCPKCKFIVEKTEGCVHITCICKYEFCYRCGAKWSSSHGGCRPRPWLAKLKGS